MIKVNCPTCGVRLSAPEELLNKPVNCQKCSTKFILSRRWTSEPLTVAGEVANGQGVSSEQADEGPMAETGVPSSDPQLNTDSQRLLGSDSNMGSGGESNLGQSFDFTLSSASIEAASIASSDKSPTELKSLSPMNSFPKRQAMSSPALPHSALSTSPVSLPPSLPEISNQQAAAETLPTTDLQHFRETASIWQFFDFQFRSYLTPGIVRVSWFLILMVVALWLLFLSYFYLSSVIHRKDFVMPMLQDQSVGLPAPSDANVLVVPRFFYNSAMYFTYTIASIVGLLWIRVLFETVMMVFSIGSHLQGKQNRKSTRKI